MELAVNMRRYGFVYNRKAGTSDRTALIENAIARLRAQRFEVATFPCDGNPRPCAEEAVRKNCDVVVAGGGDGTVNAVAGVLHGTDRQLGVLPLGTLNHFARDLGILTMADAENALEFGPVRLVDAGFVNGHIFLNNSGIGAYPAMVRERERVRRIGIPKWPAFVHACLRTLFRMPFQRLKIEADGRSVSRTTPFVFVGNNLYSLDGRKPGTRQRLDEGLLGVCTASHVGRFGIMRLAFRALMGTIREDRDFIAFSAVHLTLTRKRPFNVSLDGEVLRMKGPLHYSIQRRALRVLVPPALK